MDASQVNGLFSIQFSLSRQCHFCSCRFCRWGEVYLWRGFRKEDGWLVKNEGDDDEVGWIPAYDLRG